MKKEIISLAKTSKQSNCNPLKNFFYQNDNCIIWPQLVAKLF